MLSEGVPTQLHPACAIHTNVLRYAETGGGGYTIPRKCAHCLQLPCVACCSKRVTRGETHNKSKLRLPTMCLVSCCAVLCLWLFTGG
jgi:hypothetical protein